LISPDLDDDKKAYEILKLKLTPTEKSEYLVPDTSIISIKKKNIVKEFFKPENEDEKLLRLEYLKA
jgi:hypothetical protein